MRRQRRISDRLRCAVIGLGRAGTLLEQDRLREKPCTHAGAFAADPDCALSGGVDPDPERRRLFEERWRVPAFDSIEALFDRARPDVVAVVVPEEAHLAVVEECLRRPLKALICEKPLALSIENARRIVAWCGEAAVSVEAGRGRDHIVFELDLSFERGRVRVGNGDFELWESRPSRFYEGFRSLVRIENGWRGPTRFFSGMVHDAVRVARGSTEPPVSSAASALVSIELLEKITRRNREKV
jgi:predicted dehydrogenase